MSWDYVSEQSFIRVQGGYTPDAEGAIQEFEDNGVNVRFRMDKKSIGEDFQFRYKNGAIWKVGNGQNSWKVRILGRERWYPSDVDGLKEAFSFIELNSRLDG